MKSKIPDKYKNENPESKIKIPRDHKMNKRQRAAHFATEEIRKLVREAAINGIMKGYDAAWVDIYQKYVKPIRETSDPEIQEKLILDLINAVCGRYKRTIEKTYGVKDINLDDVDKFVDEIINPEINKNET